MIACKNCGVSGDSFFVEEVILYSRSYWNDITKVLEVRTDKGETESARVLCGSCGQDQDVKIDWR